MTQFMGITYRDISPDASFTLDGYSDYSSVKSKYSSSLENWRKIMGLGYLEPVNGKIDPATNITRAQAAQMIYNLMWK